MALTASTTSQDAGVKVKQDEEETSPFYFQVQLMWKPDKPVYHLYLQDMGLPPGQVVPTVPKLADAILGTLDDDGDAKTETLSLTYRAHNTNVWPRIDREKTLAYAMMVYQDMNSVPVRAYREGVDEWDAAGTAAEEAVVSTPPTKQRPHKKKQRSPKVATPKTSTPTQKNKGTIDTRFLRAMLELTDGMRVAHPSRVWVALCTGYTNDLSSGFVKLLGTMKQRCFVKVDTATKTLALTAAGRAAAPSTGVTASTTNAQVMACIQAKLQPKEVQLLQALGDGQPHTRVDVASIMGYTNIQSSGFTKVVGRLHKALGLVAYVDGKASLQLSDVCFPFGRP